MNGSTRTDILAALQTHPNLTIEEISRQLHLTRADVRYHMKALLKSSDVVQMPAPRTLDRLHPGRPAKTYQLSTTARPDVLGHLVHLLLNRFQSIEPDTWISEIAHQIVEPRDESALDLHISQKLNLAIDQVNTHPYQARWEAHANGPQVFFHNCPFAAVIEQHPELCQVDRLMLQNLTGLSARQTKKIDFHRPGTPACVFILSGNPIKK